MGSEEQSGAQGLPKRQTDKNATMVGSKIPRTIEVTEKRQRSTYN